MLQRRKTAIVVLIAITVAGAGLLYTTSTGTVKNDPYFPGANVRYYKPFLHSDPKFTVRVRDAQGRVLPAILSLYAWMPNGSMVSLGIYAGLGDIAVDYDAVKEAMLVWRTHLLLQGNNPDLVEPGILVFGAIHGKSGVYPLLRAITLDTDKIVRGLSVAVTIVEDLRGRPPAVSKGWTTGEASLAEGNPRSITLPLPEEAGRVCYWDSGIEGYTLSCYIWSLEEVTGLRLASGLPFVVVYLRGEVDALNHVSVVEVFESQSSKGLEIGFGATASVGDPVAGWTEYWVPGFTVKLLGDKVWLYTHRVFMRKMNFTSPAIVSVGIKGDAALLTYRLYKCSGPGSGEEAVCSPTNTVAEVSLARPVVENNQLVPWHEVDQDPDDWLGPAEQGFRAYSTWWMRGRMAGDVGVAPLTSLDVEAQIGAPPLFSVSTDVFGRGLWIPVGSTGVEAPAKFLICDVFLKDRLVLNHTIVADYFYSPPQFNYGGRYYSMGSMYLDVRVIHLSSGERR